MRFFLTSWVWIAVLAAVLAMHMFGHGGHGFKDSHVDSQPASNSAVPAPAPAPAPPNGAASR